MIMLSIVKFIDCLWFQVCFVISQKNLSTLNFSRWITSRITANSSGAIQNYHMSLHCVENMYGGRWDRICFADQSVKLKTILT
jgi:hypothetical protein